MPNPLPSSPEFQELQKKGWMTDSFLAILTQNEFESLIKKENRKESQIVIQSEVRDVLLKKRKTQLMLIPSTSALASKYWALSTGIKGIDQALDQGGLIAGELTLFYGKFRTGKSQLAFSSCCEAYRYFMKKMPRKVAIFVDTENTFRPERILQMATRLGLPGDDVLRHIYVIQVQSNNELNLALTKLGEIVQENNVKFIAVDSLTSLLRVELSKEDKDINQTINEFAKYLRNFSEIAEKFNIPILCTSQVSTSFGTNAAFNVNPILATTLNAFIKQWILLAEDENITTLASDSGLRFAHIVNGQEKKEEIIKYQITPEGIVDFY